MVRCWEPKRWAFSGSSLWFRTEGQQDVEGVGAAVVQNQRDAMQPCLVHLHAISLVGAAPKRWALSASRSTAGVTSSAVYQYGSVSLQLQ